jgi:nicotinamidase-related amidase
MARSLSELLAPRRAALVLTEVQDAIIGDVAPWPMLRDAAAKVGLVENAAQLAKAARSVRAPVIHCTAEHFPGNFGGNRNAPLFTSASKLRAEAAEHDRTGDEPHPAVWEDGDIKLPRFHGLSAMTGSPLDSLLRNEGISTLVVCGVSLSFGVLSLVMDAVNQSYQVIVPRDAVAGFPEAYAHAVLENTVRMLATVAETDEIAAAWATIGAPHA